MSRLDEMNTFVRIVDAGSISAAAEQLDMAKSGVSRRLTDLESRLGVKLINRTTRRSSLTEAGQSYYDGAVRLLADVQELDAQVAEEDKALAGTLRLAAPLSFGLCHLAPAIEQFLCEHPGLSIKVDFSDHQVDLVERGFDLAIRVAELKDSSLQARRVCPVRLMFCASPEYLEKNGTPTTPDELSDHQVLQYDVGRGQGFRVMDDSGETRTIQLEPRITANNGDFLVDMARSGRGIVLTPTFIAWKALASGELIQVLEGYAPPASAAWAVYPQTRYLARRTRVFIDFLVERFGENPYWDQFL